MNDPKTLKFTRNHEWIRAEGQEAYVGISDFAQSELGEIVYVDIATVGENLQKEEVFGSVEAVKAVSDLFLPAGGTVLEANAELEDHPELINKEPYDGGWIIKVSLDNPAELSELLSYEQYKEMIG
ncbi:MAG: glycine cleavage system protein GcvH [Bacteroidales bacterium]|nr:glycine cleavage system protein GcvH [Bacteroidales bacterium]MDD3431454.1 glycine cleavage system protein GcvH [Bacteroidales bacterium]MDD4361869.1 glycine cleavage system protein GcvH [Bacteroidales bacterium]MDD4430219.1 glycine cleavage system protein GcvH [Bacteroidales bacterium]